MRILAVIALIVASLTPSAAATPARHLRYALSVYLTAHGHGGAATFSGPGTGVMDVDIFAPAPGGGLPVRATEWWWNEPRAEQAASCELYSSGNLTCDQYPVPSIAELTLLPLLASNYFAGIDASTWQRSYEIVLPENYYSLSFMMSLHVVKWSGLVAQIEFNGVSREINGPVNKPIEKGTVSFDRSESLPVEVHEDWSQTSLDSVDDPASVDLKLTQASQ